MDCIVSAMHDYFAMRIGNWHENQYVFSLDGNIGSRMPDGRLYLKKFDIPRISYSSSPPSQSERNRIVPPAFFRESYKKLYFIGKAGSCEYGIVKDEFFSFSLSSYHGHNSLNYYNWFMRFVSTFCQIE